MASANKFEQASATARKFTLEFLEQITNNFSEEHVVGRGAYGVVYKGVLENGENIALKRLHYVSGHDDTQFRNEFTNLMRANHPNITRSVGYCYHQGHQIIEHQGGYIFPLVEERVLCFEYLEGGSLENKISDELCGLDWHTRFKIINGVCLGLNYLHNGSKDPIYHLDLKPANILLDKNMVPKIGEFGLSRLFSSTHIGTLGYMPPEYIDRNEITSKYDVFSLGVIIIQIMAGYEGYSKLAVMSSQEFLVHVHQNWRNRLQETISSHTSNQVNKCIEMALRCVEVDRNKRPTIAEIVNELNKEHGNRGKQPHATMWSYTSDQVKTCIKMALSYVEVARNKRPTIVKIVDELNKEEGGSGISVGMASTKRVDIKSVSHVLEHMLLDESVGPTNLPLALLQQITEDFTEKRQIGHGGFGVVYKGDLPNGSVAVKRLLNSHTIEEEPFNREAISLISVKHKNIVRFLGYCANTENKVMLHAEPGETLKYVVVEIRERLLCFEYINNGSLDKHLTDELRGLEWHTRYQIIRGICDGLVYLHKEKGIVHRDMKPANILVDNHMIPKITDFGLSKLLEGATHAVTINRIGSLGYCAPEFINRGLVSIKSDIYSLGVIITELVTGCKDNPDIENVLRRWRYRWNKSLSYPPSGYEQVTKCIELASMCLSDCPKRRPFIWDIIRMLNSIENTNEKINIASNSPVALISPFPWELLEFDMMELNFAFEINKQIPCSILLTNVINHYVAFNIERTGVLEYDIEPEKGIVPPQSKCNVTVTLQAQKKVPHATLCKEEFLIVRCAAVNEGLTAEGISQDMLDKKSVEGVDVVTLKVVILPVTSA